MVGLAIKAIYKCEPLQLQRIRRGTYRPQPAKWIEIPKEDGSKRPLAIACLEDTCYWGKTRKGYWRLKYKSRRDRFSVKLKEIRHYLRENLTAKDTLTVLKTVKQVVQGWINYHGILDNQRRVTAFIEISRRDLLGWFNRRGGKKPMTWQKLVKVLKAINFPQNWKTVSMF